ncbi:hypothetical protein NP493_126g02010 [Ridgeia piscesae]|uniref:Uncharacterized protein n=1 Tax=Ridgeia piscesae TaxID=27915 RepID=A0AAD9P5Q3_RIDPI|nr:hypothetical protein NP493_126g02010 [Ridgeia piscesae]
MSCTLNMQVYSWQGQTEREPQAVLHAVCPQKIHDVTKTVCCKTKAQCYEVITGFYVCRLSIFACEDYCYNMHWPLFLKPQSLTGVLPIYAVSPRGTAPRSVLSVILWCSMPKL